ncbi:Maleylacetoacetate isomerase [Halotydeus destructor]|nr:Maleylacetoacetate isomerase [Halotydeus destructor]
MAKLTLYSYFRSSCSWRVRIALNLKNIEHELSFVNIAPTEKGRQQFRPEFQALNPLSQIPVLLVDNGGQQDFLIQSIPIIEYLEEEFPDSFKLLPENALDRAKVRALAECIASGIQPLQNSSVLVKVEKLGLDKQQWANDYITQGLIALEKLLSNLAGKYCFGDTVTLADVCLVPQVYNANRFGVDMTQFPIINRVHDELNKIDAFVRAKPENQPDFPKP